MGCRFLLHTPYFIYSSVISYFSLNNISWVFSMLTSKLHEIFQYLYDILPLLYSVLNLWSLLLVLPFPHGQNSNVTQHKNVSLYLKFYYFVHHGLIFIFFKYHIKILFILFIFGCNASSLLCASVSVWWLLLQSMSSAVAVHGLKCSAACGIFLDQGSNPYPLHWEADS